MQIITMGMSLTVLDGHEITETARLFLLNWKVGNCHNAW